jgi:hypothetical protein
VQELTPLFKMLRQQGFTARQRFMCCSGCAGAAIATEFGEKVKTNPALDTKGFIFFHAQDVITEEEKRRYDHPSMMLRYSPIMHYGEGGRTQTWGLPAKEIGDAVVEALKACNIAYEWDGNPDTCIELFPFGKPARKTG